MEVGRRGQRLERQAGPGRRGLSAALRGPGCFSSAMWTPASWALLNFILTTSLRVFRLTPLRTGTLYDGVCASQSVPGNWRVLICDF